MFEQKNNWRPEAHLRQGKQHNVDMSVRYEDHAASMRRQEGLEIRRAIVATNREYETWKMASLLFE
jgi:hypothetical protein